MTKQVVLPCGCLESHHPDTVHEFFEIPTYRNSRMSISPVYVSDCVDVKPPVIGGGFFQNISGGITIGHPFLSIFYGSDGGLRGHTLVARYVAALIARPLLTKCYTNGTLCFFQEILTNHLAGVKFKVAADAPAYKRLLARLKVDSTAFKMAAYGFFISAPLGHFINTLMVRLFAGRTSRKAKFAQFLMQFFFVAPLNVFVYLVSMAIIGGAKSQTHIRAHVYRGFAKMLAFTWLVQPSALVVAKKWVPEELWSPFFSLVNFSLGTYFLTKVKKVQVLKFEEEERKKRDPPPFRPGLSHNNISDSIEIVTSSNSSSYIGNSSSTFVERTETAEVRRDY